MLPFSHNSGGFIKKGAVEKPYASNGAVPYVSKAQSSHSMVAQPPAAPQQLTDYQVASSGSFGVDLLIHIHSSSR